MIKLQENSKNSDLKVVLNGPTNLCEFSDFPEFQLQKNSQKFEFKCLIDQIHEFV